MTDKNRKRDNKAKRKHGEKMNEGLNGKPYAGIWGWV